MPTNYNPDTDALETMQERFAREAEIDERIMRSRREMLAFACAGFRDRDVSYAPQSGMTLRDYFIAHAPAEPQQWFRPQMPPRPVTRYVSEDGQQEFTSRAAAEDAVGEEGYTNVNSDAQRQWETEFTKQRYIQWPAAWADEMLKAREL